MKQKQKIDSIMNFAMNTKPVLNSLRVMYELDEQNKIKVLSVEPTEGEHQFIFFREDFDDTNQPTEKEKVEALMEFIGI